MAPIVSCPIEVTQALNFSVSTRARAAACSSSSALSRCLKAMSAAFFVSSTCSSASIMMVCASARRRAMLTWDSPSIWAAAAMARASALLAPVDSIAADSACSARSSSRSFSALALSSMICRSSSPFALCSRRSASCRAAASWDLVVISMASCTDFMRASRVLASTGSTDWISTLVTTRRLFLNSRRSRGLPVALLTPKTAAWMMAAEFLWNVSKGSPATAPRMRDAMALQASPTKSATLNTFVAAAMSPALQSKNQL
mmetsp:Transcript_139401/g.242441  ORF Transcript_139401/g.242441 Transcript_139401/m.242441 type:complete len:258 (+) Transcript_139401:1358-2131(+)